MTIANQFSTFQLNFQCKKCGSSNVRLELTKIPSDVIVNIQCAEQECWNEDFNVIPSAFLSEKESFTI